MTLFLRTPGDPMPEDIGGDEDKTLAALGVQVRVLGVGWSGEWGVGWGQVAGCTWGAGMFFRRRNGMEDDHMPLAWL